ncbi:MAG: hypothetical protein R3C08_04775 [Hyphomonas sp.]
MFDGTADPAPLLGSDNIAFGKQACPFSKVPAQKDLASIAQIEIRLDCLTAVDPDRNLLDPVCIRQGQFDPLGLDVRRYFAKDTRINVQKVTPAVKKFTPDDGPKRLTDQTAGHIPKVDDHDNLIRQHRTRSGDFHPFRELDVLRTRTGPPNFFLTSAGETNLFSKCDVDKRHLGTGIQKRFNGMPVHRDRQEDPVAGHANVRRCLNGRLGCACCKPAHGSENC